MIPDGDGGGDDDGDDGDNVHLARAEKQFDGLYILVRWYILTPHADGELAVVGRHPLLDVVVG